MQSEIGPINLINTYIPHDTQPKHHTIHTLNAITCPSKSHFLIGGDLNSYQCPRLDYYTNIQNKTTNHSKEKQFQSITNNKFIDTFRILNPLTKKYTKWTVNSNSHPIKITASRLDYFLISKSLKKKLTQAQIIENDLTNTDHYPITMKLNLLTPKKTPKLPKTHLPNYNNWPDSLANEIEKHIYILKDRTIKDIQDIENFNTIITEAIQQSLNNYTKIINQSNVKTTYKKPHTILLNKLSNLRKSLIDLKQKLMKSNPNEINSFKNNLNTINDTIKGIFPEKTEFLIPLNNFHNTITSTIQLTHKITNKLHNLSRKIKQEKIKKKIDNILESKDLSSKTIFKLIKNNKEFNHINYVTTNDDPPKIITDPDKISNTIFQKYNNFFSNQTNQKTLNHWLQFTPRLNTDTTLPTINPDTVKNTLIHKTSTSPGPDNIKYEIFKFLNKHNSSIFSIISHLYIKIIQLSYIPKSWKTGQTILLPKQDNNNNNWRPITLLNTLYKGLTTIINSHIQNLLTSSKILPNEQCGFNRNKDTSSAITTYLEIIKLSKNNNIPLHVLYIDFKAAFDSVQHWTINSILTHLNFNPILKNFINHIMTNCSTKFTTQNISTPPVSLLKGVKQGDPLSPTLFLIYLLPIQWFLIKNNPNSIANINHLCYADDMLLIAHSRNDIEQLFGNLALYTYYTDMSINNSKCQYSYINDTLQQNFQMNLINNNNVININIPTTNKEINYKYLGLNINLNLDFKDFINSLTIKYKNTVRLILRKKYLGINLIIKLFNTVAIPKIAYSMNFIKWPNQILDDLDNFNITSLCHTFHLPTVSPNHYWFLIKNLFSIKEINLKRYLTSLLDRTIDNESNFKSDITYHNHFTKPINTEHYTPPVTTIAQNLNINIIKTTKNPANIPTIDFIQNSTIEIYTDASLHIKSKSGCCAFYIPQLKIERTFPPFLPCSSTNLELQAIYKAILLNINYQNINIYTDSLSSIQSINNFNPNNKSKAIKSPTFTISNAIYIILNMRNKLKLTTNFFHVYSHLLDATVLNNSQRIKLEKMKKLYKNKYLTILKNNQHCDNIASSIRYHIIDPPIDHIGLPALIYKYNNAPFTSINKTISNFLYNLNSSYLLNHQKKRSEWFFSPLVNTTLTLKSPHIQFQNIFPKLSQSLVFTKQRAFNHYLKENLKLPPHTLIKRRNAYNNIYCHLCPNNIDNHEHGNTSCIITNSIHNKLSTKIINIIEKNSPANPNWHINLWFSNQTTDPHITNTPTEFPLKWGNIGIIPNSLINSIKLLNIQNTSDTINKIIKITHKYITLKWRIKFFSIYNKQLPAHECIKKFLL